MDIKNFLRLTKRKFLIFLVLSILLNFIFGPFSVLAVETVSGGYTVYSLGFPFSSNFISPSSWNWDIWGLAGNLLVAYLTACLMLYG